MSGIFISYRRSDSGAAAGRVYDHLSGRFGAPQVFMDITGENFVDTIRGTLDQCDVVLAIIGQQWAAVTDESGQRHLDNPEDYVRQEIALALEKRLRVIPVLVDDATMPTQADLPPNLRRMAALNGLSLRDESFKENINYLTQTILDFRASDDPPLSPLEHTAPFPAIMPPIPLARQQRNQWLWVAVLLILLPLNCLLGAIPALVGALALTPTFPVAWPFARNAVLVTQGITLLTLVYLFFTDFLDMAPALFALLIVVAILLTILALIGVRHRCRKILFELPFRQ